MFECRTAISPDGMEAVHLKHIRLLYLLFFFSGISGLMYEVVWLRMISRIVGVTLYATSTVLAAYMAGLALGSLLLGIYIDRRNDHLKVYSILEVLIGATALSVPVLFMFSVPLYQFVHYSSGENHLLTALLRAVVSFLCLLVPTTLMGGTLPVLIAYRVRREGRFGKNLGLFYGLNTAGAVAGVLVSGFITIGALGEWATVLIGVAINISVAAAALSLHWRESRIPGYTRVEEAPTKAVETVPHYSDALRRFVLVAFALSGLSALAYEVIWTRQLILFLQTSVYAFSGMLATFLTGIALGSLFMNRFVDRMKSPLRVFGLLEVAIGLLSIVNLHLFLPLDGHMGAGDTNWPVALASTVVLVFPMTFMFGMIFPVAGRCYAKRADRTGSSVGWLYSSNTIGSILGSLLAGFLLIPLLGSTASVIVFAALNGSLGLVLLVLDPAKAFGSKAACALVVPLFLVATWGVAEKDPFLSTIEGRIRKRAESAGGASGSPDYEIFLNKEGLEGTLTAFSANGGKGLWVNGMGMTFLCTETKLMAHLPLLFSRDPGEFLVICFGMGTSLKSATKHPGLNITSVELVPEVYRAFKFFHSEAEGILGLKNVSAIENDGRNFLLLTRKKFDVITIDPAPPIWSAGTVNLYSKEFFALCRSRLTPAGVVCLWFPGGTKDEVKSLLRTFDEVFPGTIAWSGSRAFGYYFIGCMEEKVPWDRFRSNADRMFKNKDILRDLAEYDLTCVTKVQLENLLLWREGEVDVVARDGSLITDDHPYTEFPLWRYLFGDSRRWQPQRKLLKRLNAPQR